MLSTREIGSLMKAVAEVVQEHVGKAFGALSARVDELDEKIASIPAGKDGAPGADGRDGSDGANGQDGVDGKDGAPGKDGADGKDGEPGKDGRDGVDGKSLTVDDIRPVLEGLQASWALDFERRAQDVLQRAIDRMPVPNDGKDGIDGKDGRDALDIEDFAVTQDDDGRVTLRFVRGDVSKEFALRLPVFVDRGVFKAEDAYERGNGVTWAGSFWIAQKDAPSGKPGESADWRLAVKKGRDGKDGEKGERGAKGEPGKSWVKTDSL